ncbi:MAG: agmatinase [Methylobacterium sp.]|nr:agmatinase [Methylobacterium sp.]
MTKPPVDHAFTGGPRGGAHDPTFAGAHSFMRRPYTKNLAGADVVIWGVPFDLSVTNRPGTRFGPAAIRRASAIFDGDPQYPSGIDPFERLAVIDYGDCALPRGDLASHRAAIEAEATRLVESGAHLMTMGGDHFITLPLLRAHARRHGPMGLLQFDAHQDSWDHGPGVISHGTFVVEAIREGLIDPGRSIQVGIRTIAPGDGGIAIIHAYEAAEMGVTRLAEAIRARLGGGASYLTFDIDCLDPAFAPGTGTPVSGGMSATEALRLVWALRDLPFCGMDVVEVSPPYDHAEITAIAGATIMQHHLQALALRRA